jgi:hypothetical protein
MITHFFHQLLFAKKSVSFASEYGLEESVQRLQAAIKKPLWIPFVPQKGVAGKVSAAKVALYYLNPRIANSFAPHYRGSFQTRNGKVFLDGHFSMHPFSKACCALWFGLLAVMGIFAITLTLWDFISPSGKNHTLLSFLITIGSLSAMACCGIGLLTFSKWLARNDEGHISETISSALQSKE